MASSWEMFQWCIVLLLYLKMNENSVTLQTSSWRDKLAKSIGMGSQALFIAVLVTFLALSVNFLYVS